MPDKFPILKATNFIAFMTTMVMKVFGTPGDFVNKYVEKLRAKIHEMFGTRPGQDSEEIKNATWEKINEMFEVLLSAEEEKEDRIKQILK